MYHLYRIRNDWHITSYVATNKRLEGLQTQYHGMCDDGGIAQMRWAGNTVVLITGLK